MKAYRVTLPAAYSYIDEVEVDKFTGLAKDIGCAYFEKREDAEDFIIDAMERSIEQSEKLARAHKQNANRLRDPLEKLRTRRSK